MPQPLSVPTARQTAADIRVLAGRLRRKLTEQASPGEFTTAQSAVATRIERDGPASGSDLAKAEGMKPQSMGPILISLEERGILVSFPDPADGRKTLWSMTDDARRAIAEARATKEDWLLRTIQSKLSEAEQRDLAVGVALLERLLEP